MTNDYLNYEGILFNIFTKNKLCIQVHPDPEEGIEVNIDEAKKIVSVLNYWIKHNRLPPSVQKLEKKA